MDAIQLLNYEVDRCGMYTSGRQLVGLENTRKLARKICSLNFVGDISTALRSSSSIVSHVEFTLQIQSHPCRDRRWCFPIMLLLSSEILKLIGMKRWLKRSWLTRKGSLVRNSDPFTSCFLLHALCPGLSFR